MLIFLILDFNSTFNIPDLVQRFIEGGNENIGRYMSPGLPNITGNVTGYWNIFGNVAGSFNGVNTTQRDYTVNGSELSISPSYNLITLDASRSSNIYGNSVSVQPRSLYMTYVIKY